MTHYTHCALRLGDNLAALQLVRKLAQAHPDRQFEHACPFEYMRLRENLLPVVADLPNVRLVDISQTKPDSVDLWKGAGGWFYAHPNWREYVPVMLDFYKLMSVRIGLPCPINSKEDMLFDYPALGERAGAYSDFSWLVVNSPPLSGQLPGYRMEEMDALILALCARHGVVTTAPTSHGKEMICAQRYSITQIGRLSQDCRNILMVSTGPSWPTFNIWNHGKIQRRIILLANERVELAPNTVHCGSVAEAGAYLRMEGII
jgi:hypothetical protein